MQCINNKKRLILMAVGQGRPTWPKNSLTAIFYCAALLPTAHQARRSASRETARAGGCSPRPREDAGAPLKRRICREAFLTRHRAGHEITIALIFQRRNAGDGVPYKKQLRVFRRFAARPFSILLPPASYTALPGGPARSPASVPRPWGRSRSGRRWLRPGGWR